MVSAWAQQLVNDPTGAALAAHLIEFNPKTASGYHFAAEPDTPEALALVAQLQPDPIPWPDSLAPTPVTIDPQPLDTDPLPTADVLVVTYTVAEGEALADVLAPRPAHHQLDPVPQRLGGAEKVRPARRSVPGPRPGRAVDPDPNRRHHSHPGQIGPAPVHRRPQTAHPRTLGADDRSSPAPADDHHRHRRRHRRRHAAR